MKKVEVLFRGWGQDWVLGTLADNGSHLLFEYSAQALQRGIEFSTIHLKLRSQAYSGFPAHLGGLPGLVSDALPIVTCTPHRRNSMPAAGHFPLSTFPFSLIPFYFHERLPL